MKMVTLLVALVIFCLVSSMVFARQQSTENISLQQHSSKAIERIAFGSWERSKALVVRDDVKSEMARSCCRFQLRTLAK